MKKIICMILSVIMCLSMLSAAVLASEITVTLDFAYITDDDFTMFIDLTDERMVVVDDPAIWPTVEDEGALDGSALKCMEAAMDVEEEGWGVTITFAVPTDGEYTFWVRTLFPNQLANSLFCSIDGSEQYIWDFPDEDGEAECYGSWQYFYMTERASGSYADTSKYGTFTIQHGEWRHKPRTVELKAGLHTMRIGGREANMLLDELVITSLTSEEYDPNQFEIAGNINEDLLDVCKFCGTNWKHYVSDIYAQLGVPASEYFCSNLYNVEYWEDEYNLISGERETTEETTVVTTEETTEEKTEVTTEETTVETAENTTEEKTEKETEKATEKKDETEKPEESGCASVVGFSTIAAVTAIAACGTVAFRKRKERQNEQ